MTKRPRARQKKSTAPDGVLWDASSEQPLLASNNDLRPFNPLDTKNLAIAVAKAMLEREARPIDGLPVFRGAGIYAIYYTGNFPAYRQIADANRDARQPRWPIYIGKAQPPGGRRGNFNLEASDTTALHSRLREHADSIRAANNIDIGEFQCRFLIVQDLWIPLAEQLLITHFAPVWNRLIDGFGNHNPGAGRYEGVCPRWDVLHPGRGWAAKCRPRLETAADIQREVAQHLANAAPPSLSLLSGDVTDQ